MSLVKDLFIAGSEVQIRKDEEKEKTKIGTLRAGNTGMVMEDGAIVGSCAAQTYLRMLGINGKSVTVEKSLMFAGGRLNEDHWLSVLKESYDGPILCEEDIATHWQTDQGISVTGRPDIVLCRTVEEEIEWPKDDPFKPREPIYRSFSVPVCMIELKQVMSVNSAYNVLIKKEPQLKHLMQAAHYMHELDCPGELWYTNRNNLDAPDWLNFRPMPPDAREEVLGFRYYKQGDINPRTGKPKKHKLTEDAYLEARGKVKAWRELAKIYPFVQGFKLELRDGELWYQDTHSENTEWVQSIVTIDRIKRFYNYVGDLPEYGKVPAEALNLTATGEKIAWKFSDYSDLAELDPAHWTGTDLDSWVDKIRAKVSEDSSDK